MPNNPEPFQQPHNPEPVQQPLDKTPLPNRSHGSAPKFDGKPWSLLHFLTEVRSLANDRGLPDKRAIEAALMYAPTSEFELWRSLEAAKGNDWEKFVQALVKLYPSAGGDRKFCKNDLKLLVSRSSQVPMTDQVMLGEYYRSFINIVTFLEEKKRIYPSETSEYFMQGFHPKFRQQLIEQLEREHLRHYTEDGWKLETLYDAALYVLSKGSGTAGLSPPSFPEFLGNPKSNEVVPGIKTEYYDGTNLEKLFTSEAFRTALSTAVSQVAGSANNNQNRQNRGQNSNGQAYQRNQNQGHANHHHSLGPGNQWDSQNNNNRQGQRYNHPIGCLFCSDPNHFIYNCPICEEYLAKGYCARNNWNQVCLANGARITRTIAPGNNFKEQIDHWRAANIPQGTAATNTFAKETPPHMPNISNNFFAASFMEPEDDSEDQETPEDDPLELPPTERELEDLQMWEAMVLTAQKKVDEGKKRVLRTTGATTRDLAKQQEKARVVEPPTQ